MPTGPLFKLRAVRCRSWRCVEHQATIATKNLVAGNLRDHDILEGLLEDNKPPIPDDAKHLHWLAATPFRYFRAYESRFGPKGRRGVWYGAAKEEVALREFTYHRQQFFAAYDGDKPHTLTVSLIQANLASNKALDLSSAAFNRRRKRIEDPEHYGECHRIAEKALAQGVELIVYNSARTPPSSSNRTCHAVIHPAGFGSPSIRSSAARTVSITLSDGVVRASFDATRRFIEFAASSLNWQKNRED